MIFGPMWHMGQPKIYTKEKCKSLSGKVGDWITHAMNPAENQSTWPNRQKDSDTSELCLFVLFIFNCNVKRKLYYGVKEVRRIFSKNKKK